MKRSTDRILTSITGSLPRSDALIDVMREKENDRPYDKAKFEAMVRDAVTSTVHRECEIGLSVPSDGEQSKSGFGSYQAERFAGFSVIGPVEGGRPFASPEIEEFPEYYERYFRTNMLGATLGPRVRRACTGPVQYIGHQALQADIANFKAALAGQTYEEAFIPSAEPLSFTSLENRYYKTQDEFEEACIEATREEYKGIIDAGLLLQIDDPGLGTRLWDFRDLPEPERAKRVDQRVERINYALRGLPADRIRYHSCYSINHGPLTHSMALREWAPIALRINAQAFSFEVMNPRHMHDYHTFEDVKVPDGKILMPGMISHGHNWVEHPELIAELTVNYAKLVGRENVQIGSDCGFASQAGAREVDPKVVWAKLAALVEGAALATKQLWGR